MVWLLNRSRIGHRGGQERLNKFQCLQFPRTYPRMTTPFSRSQLWHLQLSGDAIKSLHRLTNCHQCGWRCIIHLSRLNDSRNLPFSGPVLLISLTEVDSRVSPAWLHQFVKLHLLLPKTLHVLLYCFRDWAHHPSGFVIFDKLAPRFVCL